MAESVAAPGRATARAGISLGEFAVLGGCALLLVLPVLLWGPTRGHDVTIHLHWVESFRRSLSEGCWYPRWLSWVNNGSGSPTFVFYFPALAYASSLVSLATPDLITAIWVVSALALWASGVAMAAFLRPYCRSAAVVGGVVYMAAPYHLLDLYERSAFPEAMALAWVPMILATMDRHAASASPRWLAAVALATGGLTLTHHGLLVLFLPLLLAHAALGRTVRTAALDLGALLLGLGIGAVSLLPAVAERAYVHWPEPYFRYLFLFHPGPTYGFREFADRLERDSLYYAVMAVFGIAVAWKLRSRVAVLLGATSVLSFFLACEPSLPIWEALPPLQVIDIPWRWLAVASFSSAALVALAVDDGTFLRLAGIACAVLGIAFGVKDWILPANYSPSLRAAKLDDSSWADVQVFVPRWAPTEIPAARGPRFNGRWIALSKADCASQEYDTSADREVTLELDTFYYPGWVARIDGEPVPIRPSFPTGRITMRVPKGQHRVVVQFENTPIRSWAAGITIVALVVTAGILALGERSGLQP